MFVFLVAIFCFGFLDYYAGGCASCRVARAQRGRPNARNGENGILAEREFPALLVVWAYQQNN